MPAKFQSAVVLFELEGLTHEAVARQLGCPVGTIESRLTRGRQRLRAGLTRRGFTSWTMVSGPTLRGRLASGSVPPNLANATIYAAVRATVEGAMAEVVPAAVRALGAGFFEAMVLTRIKLALPVDHLLVWGNLPMRELAQVKEGQACEVLVPFLDRTIATKVDWIAK